MWQCGRCGSREQRKGGKGCAECHRRYGRARRDEEFPLTPAMLNYLKAFDRFLEATKTGDPVELRESVRARHRALRGLEG